MMRVKDRLLPLILLWTSLIVGISLPLRAGILPLTSENSLVGTLAGSGQPGSRDGADSQSWFQWPTGLAVDPRGNLFVADFNNNQIRKVTREGVVTTVAGSGLGGHKDGIGLQAMFHGPQSVALDEEGNIFVADADNFRFRKILAIDRPAFSGLSDPQLVIFTG